MIANLLIRVAQVTNPFPNVPANQDTVTNILNNVFLVVGSLAVLFIVIGGFRYIISGGDSQSTAKARNTIIYAAVGLAVTLAATAIVNLVLGKIQ